MYFQVSEQDMLPTNICEHCTFKLDMLYEFRETSRKSEMILKRYISNADFMSKDGQVGLLIFYKCGYHL